MRRIWVLGLIVQMLAFPALAETGSWDKAQNVRQSIEQFQVFLYDNNDGAPIKKYLVDCYRGAEQAKSLQRVESCMAVDLAITGMELKDPDPEGLFFDGDVMVSRMATALEHQGIGGDVVKDYMLNINRLTMDYLKQTPLMRPTGDVTEVPPR